MNWQAPDLTVEFLQKVYVENVLNHQHAVWDVHTSADRWWVYAHRHPCYQTQAADGVVRKPQKST